MRTSIAAVVVLALGAAAGAQEESKKDDATVVREWLVLAPVDVVARRPLRPDAVLAKHLLDRAAAPPKAGDEVTGTLGKPAAWKAVQAKDDGEVGGDDAIGWAYARVESAEEKVVLAKLEGAQTLYVNGAGFTGDVYRLGDVGVPVALRKGGNDVYVAGTRGGFRLRFRRPELQIAADPGGLSFVIDPSREVWQDVVGEGPSEPAPASVRVLNASTSTAVIKGVPVVPLGVHATDRPLLDEPPPPRRVGGLGPRRRTFVSEIDWTAQSYALVPPAPSDIDPSKIGLVLSLHGAGVDCMDQARAYAPKPDFWIVCPTNRGRYGFDWQDWGRLDAYEVLEDALKVTGVDPRRVYLTGHSMGGHGTWHLAANDPGRFLAIAPSAGWSSFESYGGGATVSPLAWMWRAADGASRTLDLASNLAQVPTYVLHGEDDDNVPASEARLMLHAIVQAGGKPQSHFEPGAGHWWDKDEAPGADCVDWPGIWELFRRHEPSDSGPDKYALTSMSPPIARDHAGWFEIEQCIDDGVPSRVSAEWDGAWDESLRRHRNRATFRTENVRMLRWAPPEFSDGTRADNAGIHGTSYGGLECVIDGQRLAAGDFFEDFAPTFERFDGRWRLRDVPDAKAEKSASRSGPFKQAFTNRFVLVYGTAGDDAEGRELLEKARFDSFVWAYRANGDANLMSDAQFLAGDFKDRNVILYGNADTNAAWSAVFDDDCPIQAKRGSITVGGAKHEGVLAAAFVRPRKGSRVALAAAFADTGAAATRLFYAFPVFVSGVGIPDYVVFGAGYLRELDGDVRAAGWFDHAWKLR